MKKLPAALAALALSLPVGCASTTPAAEAPYRRNAGMTEEQAQTLVAAFEKRQVAPGKAIAAPTDLKSALDVLKADRIDAFPASVAFLKSQSGYDALSLTAQTLLAWGEAELVVAEVLARTAGLIEQDVRAVELRRRKTDADKKFIADERARIDLFRETDEALRILAAEHVASGAELAEKAVAEKPTDYVGYRIAADAARLRNDWPTFTDNVTRVQAANPDSNGLRFLRGVEAFSRDGHAREAATHFREALQHDPVFVRAQAQLVLVAPNIFEQHKELMALKAMAADHQLVRWAGPGIEAAHAAAIERQRAIQNAITNRPQSLTNAIQ
jgi:hypothetical protein